MKMMMFGNYQAIIKYDEDIDLFRGEFTDLNGGADFYASDAAGLKKEGEKSLAVFLEACRETGVQPQKNLSTTEHKKVIATKNVVDE